MPHGDRPSNISHSRYHFRRSDETGKKDNLVSRNELQRTDQINRANIAEEERSRTPEKWQNRWKEDAHPAAQSLDGNNAWGGKLFPYKAVDRTRIFPLSPK